MQQENSRIHPVSILFVTEMERFRPGSNWLYDAVWSGSYLFTTQHWQFLSQYLLTQFVQIAKEFWEEPNFVSTFSKSYKTRGSRYPGSLTWKFQALKAVLYVRTGYRVRSVAVRINPLQTLLISTNPYLHRSKPFFIRSAHALTRVVPYLTVSFS